MPAGVAVGSGVAVGVGVSVGGTGVSVGVGVQVGAGPMLGVPIAPMLGAFSADPPGATVSTGGGNVTVGAGIVSCADDVGVGAVDQPGDSSLGKVGTIEIGGDPAESDGPKSTTPTESLTLTSFGLLIMPDSTESLGGASIDEIEADELIAVADNGGIIKLSSATAAGVHVAIVICGGGCGVG